MQVGHVLREQVSLTVYRHMCMNVKVCVCFMPLCVPTQPLPTHCHPFSQGLKEGRGASKTQVPSRWPKIISTSLGALSLNPVPPVSQADASSVWVSLKKYWPDPSRYTAPSPGPRGPWAVDYSLNQPSWNTHLSLLPLWAEGQSLHQVADATRAVILLPANLQGKQRWREE